MAPSEEGGQVGKPLESRARGDDLVLRRQSYVLGIARVEADAGGSQQPGQAFPHLRAEVVEPKLLGTESLQQEARVDACAASHLDDARTLRPWRTRLKQEAEHLFGHLVLHAGFAVVSLAGTGEAFGYLSFVHTSCK